MFGKIVDKNNILFKKTIKKKTESYKKKEVKEKKKSHKGDKKEISNKRKIINKHLEGSKFRLLNELLYTTTSEEALNHFKENKSDFETYHIGFRSQASEWEWNPLCTMIDYIKNNASKQINIVDLGCGDGRLEEELSLHGFKNINSFDLAANRSFIKVADISHLPIKDNSVDLGIFCLSLMGVNYLEFLKEASRIIKFKGELLIAEVESRSFCWKYFELLMNCIGFYFVENSKINESERPNNYFRIMHFRKSSRLIKKCITIENEEISLEEASIKILRSCAYKKR